MATSLTYELLNASHDFTPEDFERLAETTRRLLRAELYEALNRDEDIMHLLIELIKDDRAGPKQAQLFNALVERMRQNYDHIMQP